jgi:pyruvate formate lyase activating enzyme
VSAVASRQKPAATHYSIFPFSNYLIFKFQIILQGIIFDIKRFAVHDGPGIRTTVFLKGCPLRCKWCHNPESWHPDPVMVEKEVALDGKLFREKEQIGRLVTVREVMAEIEKEYLIMEESGGGVTFSGGEPLMQPAFLCELLKECSLSGFHTAVDTSGYAPTSDFERILPFTGLFLYDLKMMDSLLHERFTGNTNQIILENFRWLMQQGKQVIVRIPAIGGFTATDENLRNILDFLVPFSEKIKQVDLLPFHRIGMNKYAKLGIPCEMPGEEGKPGNPEMEVFRGMFEKEGFKVKIGG